MIIIRIKEFAFYVIGKMEEKVGPIETTNYMKLKIIFKTPISCTIKRIIILNK